jgi:hypothetical protein
MILLYRKAGVQMPETRPGVAPGVSMTPNYRVRVEFTKVLEWWQKKEDEAYKEALRDGFAATRDARILIAWGLILAGMEAAGFTVDQIEEEWGVPT